MWIKIGQKGLIILFSIILFLIFPLTAILVPGVSGLSGSENYSGIDDFNTLTGKDLNLYEQSKYFLKKYGKDQIDEDLTNELDELFNYKYVYGNAAQNIDYENHHRKGIIEKDNAFNQTTWENNYINRLFTKWDKDKPVIISANSLDDVYNNAVIQINKIKNQSTKPIDEKLLTKLDFYLDLLKFSIVNEIAIIDKMKTSDYMKKSFYTPLIFKNQSDDSQLWINSNNFTATGFNAFLTYSFRFYAKIIKLDFLKPTESFKENYGKYDINKKLKSKLVIPNYFNIFRQMLIMWQRPSLTQWKYEMNLDSNNDHIVYNFFNNHDFIPYYQKDDDKKIHYFDVEKSAYQFNLTAMYICYVLIGIGFIILSWLSYRKEDLV